MVRLNHTPEEGGEARFLLERLQQRRPVRSRDRLLDGDGHHRHAASTVVAYRTVWTGSKMVVWGGSAGGVERTGGQYDPAADAWKATNTTGSPFPRTDHSAVWTGQTDDRMGWE